jgi:hypothetical protein
MNLELDLSLAGPDETVSPMGNGTSIPIIPGVHVFQEGTPGADVKIGGQGSNSELQMATNELVKNSVGKTTEGGVQQSLRGDNSFAVC